MRHSLAVCCVAYILWWLFGDTNDTKEIRLDVFETVNECKAKLRDRVSLVHKTADAAEKGEHRLAKPGDPSYLQEWAKEHQGRLLRVLKSEAGAIFHYEKMLFISSYECRRD